MTAVHNAAREVRDADPAEVSPAQLREAMGQFATGVTVVTSVGADGEPVGTTANAVACGGWLWMTAFTSGRAL